VRALGIFVKAPRPGRVKTRLAVELGRRAATRLYRRMGRDIVAAAAGVADRTTVWFAPRRGGAAVRRWLAGLAGLEFRAQTGRTLGDRLAAAFAREFATGARHVVIIGSDCPDLDARRLRAAFAALRRRDVVLGPALDGGYYLIGLARPAPRLFRGIAWSTAGVAAQTLRRARALGLGWHLLPALRDVDTAADARATGLLNS
jgi:rSAM/selenodomain-associated transferase 1